ncbi:MAG: WYL domain-containing protein [Phycisphaerales bacterium]|nr:WYL domain-containing protein [Phycisphaerales bacterium]
MSSLHTINERALKVLNLLRKKPLTFNELRDSLKRWEPSEEKFDISQRTLQRTIKDIRDYFNVAVIFDRSKGVYRINIDNEEDDHTLLLTKLECYDMVSIFNITNLERYVSFERRQEKGLEHFPIVINAMRSGKQLSFSYNPLTYISTPQAVEQKRIIEPYLLKEYDRRWYIVCREVGSNDFIKTFALDRVNDVHIINKKIDRSKIVDIKKMYEHCVGIITPHHGTTPGKLEKIIFTTTVEQGRYFQNFALHPSQKIIQETQTKIWFELTVVITYDLVQKLKSYGSYIQILEPNSLKKEMLELIKELKKLYKKE